MAQEDIVTKALKHVELMFAQHPPFRMYFHNLKHTYEVFEAAQEITNATELDADSTIILKLAALLHDTGYIYQYNGHEERSKVVAGNFLLQNGCDMELIERVIGCIEATKIPQEPKNIEEQIICDADLFHFSRSDYFEYAANLKKEWESHLNSNFTDHQWAEINLQVLKKHIYFTTYGQTVLQPLKAQNISALQNYLSNEKDDKWI